ncbi:MAG TPA: hypothetical protein VF986_02090 [Actinomycetota bacterium]
MRERGFEQAEPVGRAISGLADLEPIHEIVTSLIGQVCWMVEFTYPSVLNLHWGPEMTFRTPLGEDKKGTWILDAFGSEWVISCPEGKQVRSHDDEETTRAAAKRTLEGAATTSFDVLFPTLNLRVGFSNGCVLRLWAEEDDAEGSVPMEEGIEDELTDVEVEDWALFCPNDLYLRFGPGPKWWYGPRQMAS